MKISKQLLEMAGITELKISSQKKINEANDSSLKKDAELFKKCITNKQEDTSWDYDWSLEIGNSNYTYVLLYYKIEDNEVDILFDSSDLFTDGVIDEQELLIALSDITSSEEEISRIMSICKDTDYFTKLLTFMLNKGYYDGYEEDKDDGSDKYDRWIEGQEEANEGLYSQGMDY